MTSHAQKKWEYADHASLVLSEPDMDASVIATISPCAFRYGHANGTRRSLGDVDLGRAKPRNSKTAGGGGGRESNPPVTVSATQRF